MSSHHLPYIANCSIMFTELPLLERAGAAKAAGFDAVEFWWPFAGPVPPHSGIDAFARSIRDAGVRLAGLNFFAGDLAGPDCGVLSIPARSTEFRDNIDVAVGIGERLGCRAFNALYGNRTDDSTPDEQDALAAENLALAARAVQRIGGTVLVEPVSGAPRYPLLTARDALAAIDRAGAENIALLLDVYHLAVNGDDVDAAIDTAAGRIGHVQIADDPGRGAPGTGSLPLAELLGLLRERGYEGWVGLEYKPGDRPSAEAFDWLPREARAARTVRAAGPAHPTHTAR